MVIWIVQQYPARMRYSGYFGKLICAGLRKRGFDASLVYNTVDRTSETRIDFLPVNCSINFELKSLIKLHENYRPGDVVFVLDPSYPGYVVNLRTWVDGPIITYCHATSLNNLDIFEAKRSYKWDLERAFLNSCDIIFVATNYHKAKLRDGGVTSRIEVVGFPFPPTLGAYMSSGYNIGSTVKRILVPTRQHKQKINSEIVDQLQHLPIEIKHFNCWPEYYTALNQYHVVASFAQEETFGIATAEACFLGTPVLVPNKYAYEELYPEEFKYNNAQEFIDKYYNIVDNWSYYSGLASSLRLFNFDFMDHITNHLNSILS